MAWPKGIQRGPQTKEHKAKRLKAVSSGQKARWKNPTKRAIVTAALKASWSVGARSRKRVVWTTDMDEMLRNMHATLPWKVLRIDAPLRIGVCDRIVRERIKALGLLSKRHTCVWTKEMDASLQSLIETLPILPWSGIAKAMGLSSKIVQWRAKLLGLTKRAAPSYFCVMAERRKQETYNSSQNDLMST
jgi:hypothetical protein